MSCINEVLLRRKNKVNIVANPEIYNYGCTEKAMIASIMKNIEAYGYTFSEEVIEVLLTYPSSDIKEFYFDLIPKLKKLVGADKEYHPMYPNFPEQVMEASDAELYINAMVHYLTFGELRPEYDKNERFPLVNTNKMTVLMVGTNTDIWDIFENIVGSKTSISGQDKSDIEEIISTYPDFYNHMPDEIPLKENVALLTKIITKKAAIKDVNAIQKYFKTATDVLRFVTALSDGDISLATQTKYRSLKRCERRMVMDLLAGCGNILEDMYRYHYTWIRVGEILHPFEFKNYKYNNVVNAFNTLRNKVKPLFLPGKIQECIRGLEMNRAAELLKNRPGDFARNLDKVLRDATNKNQIINAFKEIASSVSTPVLLQVRQHFIGRNSDNPVRVFFPKGNIARPIVIKNDLPKIDDMICREIIKTCNSALVKNYKGREYFGSVYIDADLKNYLVPFSQRSASSTSKTVVRGSKMSIRDNAEAVRAFIWWTNTGGCMEERVDIDLSAAIYDDNWNYVEHVSYTNLRSEKVRAYHSGDIIDGGFVNGKGVSEFLDVDIDFVSKHGRYVVYQIYNFTRQNFSMLPNCRFGWMERECVHSGEIFEPSTVEMCMDVRSNSTVAIPVIFDCKERKVIWCDMNLGINETRSCCGGNNLESNLRGTTASCYAMTHLNKPNLYDLVMLNAIARGVIVPDRNEADIIFSNDTTVPIENVETINEETGETGLVQIEKTNVKIVTAYDIDYFMGKMI